MTTWKCPCGWTGHEPAVAYDENDLVTPIEVFCPLNCGKEPSFIGEPAALTTWWNDWYKRRTEPVVAEQ